MQKPKELIHLIKLLDDTDEDIFSHVEEKLLSFGPDAIPVLEDAWSKSFDVLLQGRIEKIVHKIQFDALKAELKIWTLNESSNLLKGAILAARYQYPDLKEKTISDQVEKIKKDVWLEINDKLTALEKVKILNKIFFDVHGFAGNTTNYHAPQNSFINIVLETKRGNPLLLALIYSVIAQDLHIPIYGVNLPEHFVLAYLDTSETLLGKEKKIVRLKEKKPERSILFYINAFSKGSVFSVGDIHSFLKQLKINPEPEYFAPCTNIAIIQRMFRNLSFSYSKLGFAEKIEEINELMGSLE